MREVRVLLADPNPFARAGMRHVLGARRSLKPVAEASDGPEALRKAAEGRVDVAVLNYDLPGLSGPAVVRRFRKAAPRVKAIVVSLREDPGHLLEIAESGAVGCLLKDDGPHELAPLVEAAAEGRAQLCVGVREAMALAASRPGTGAPFHALTPREVRVLELVADGLTTREIGRRLSISARTVDTYRANLLEKLGARTPAQLVRQAIRRRLLKP